MSLFPIFILVIQLVISDAAIIPEPDKVNTFYNALEQKCPLIKDVTNFKNQDIFTKCTDWKKINELHSLTEDSENEFLCLLYFDSLGIYCSKLSLVVSQPLVNVTPYFTPAVGNLKVETICKNLSIFSSGNKYEHNITQWMTNENECIKLCSTYSDNAKTECIHAYYYANAKFSPKIQKSGSETEPRGKVEENTNQGAKSPGQGQPIGSEFQGQEKASVPEPQGQDQGQIQVVPGEAKDPAKAEVGKSAPVATASKTAVETSKTGAQADKKAAPSNEVHGDTVAVDSKPQNEQQSVPHQVKVDTSEQQKTPEAVPAEPEQATNGKTSTQNEPTKKIEGGSTVVAQVGGKADEAPKTEVDMELGDSLEIEQPAVEDANIENPDENPPFDEDDEEGQYKKEEAKQKLDTKVEEPDTNVNNQDPKIEQDKTQDLLNQEQKKESDSVVLEPNSMPINSANVGDIDGESYFFSYFMAICVLFVLGYVGYHNRQKVMALVVEGKRGKRQYRGRRPNSANYHKLDSNLEEAISSSVNKNSSHVIY